MTLKDIFFLIVGFVLGISSMALFVHYLSHE